MIIAAKFQAGAWITVLLIPATVMLFRGIRSHYGRVANQLARSAGIDTHVPPQVSVIVPIKSWDNLTEKALWFARGLSTDVTAVHVFSDPEEGRAFEELWTGRVQEPLRDAGMPEIPLVRIASPYRRLLTPLLGYVDELRQQRKGMIAVILPDLVEGRWWESLLHTQRAKLLRSMLLMRGHQRVAVISVPWYVERRRKPVVYREAEGADALNGPDGTALLRRSR